MHSSQFYRSPGYFLGWAGPTDMNRMLLEIQQLMTLSGRRIVRGRGKDCTEGLAEGM